ncbi:hypothetical protein FRC16_002582, partial [Serendipita sp. 398]
MTSVRFQESPISIIDRKASSYEDHTAYPMANVGVQTRHSGEDDLDEEDSPYEEVRASVSNTDDPSMPVNTFRMWTIGLLLTILGAGMNTFFIFRSPYRLIVSYAVLLIAFPIGRFMAYILPIRQWKLPRWIGGGSFSLNPGPFNIKEHVCIYMMANAAVFPTYAMNTIVTTEHYYNLRWGIGFNFCLAISTQITGFGYAGVFRRLLVKPASLIWPQNLVISTLLNTLHAEEDFTFYMSYMPMGDTNTYDRFGKVYNISRILTPQVTLNLTAYEEYSDLYLSPPYISSYLLTFSLSTCIITHTILYHGRTLWNSFRHVDPEEEDIHAKLMKAYPEVPGWWYWTVIIGFFLIAAAAVQAWPTKVPVYALILSVVLPAIYMLPGGLIFAVTGQPLSLNVLAQIIPGMLLPGNPIANMVFKCYSIETLYSAQQFSQDLKLGHYIKVPPRTTFFVQLIASCLSIVTQVGVKEWLFSVVPDMCSSTQKDNLTCPRHRVYFNASAIWGLVGPTRMFGPGALYNVFLWALFAGALAPFPLWYYQRRFPSTRLKYVNLPVMLNGPQSAPPATGINYVSFFIVGFIF